MILFRVVDGRWRSVGPASREDWADRVRACGAFGWQQARLVHALAHRCPACGHVGHCDVWLSAFSAEDRHVLRCRACRQAWARDRIGLDEVTDDDVAWAGARDDFSWAFLEAVGLA